MFCSSDGTGERWSAEGHGQQFSLMGEKRQNCCAPGPPAVFFPPASAQHSGFFREGKDTHQKYHGGDNRIHRTGWVCCCGIQSATANLSCPCFFPTCKDGRNHTRCSNAVRSRRPTRTARCMPLASCLCSAAVVVAVAVGSSPVFRVMSVHPVGIPYCRHVCNQERTHACDTPGPEIQDDL